jgi:hypothetical protein
MMTIVRACHWHLLSSKLNQYYAIRLRSMLIQSSYLVFRVLVPNTLHVAHVSSSLHSRLFYSSRCNDAVISVEKYK